MRRAAATVRKTTTPPPRHHTHERPNMDPIKLSAAELGRAIDQGRVDPRDLTQAYLAAVDESPEGPRIYARITRGRATDEAEAAHARARSGHRLGPLDGVPVSWKDLFDTAGVATEAGSGLLADRIPERDAEVLRSASTQGLICLGKTHMSELAFSGLGLNPVTETPPCVNDPGAVPGGSSSGAAASVAFGMAAAAVGSDTGGSVRIPAAWNNLVGLKTTAGRLSCSGVVPLCKRFDTVGPLTRTVEDAALMLSALEGSKPVDLGGADLSGMRLAILKTVVFDDLRAAPGAAFDAAVARLSAAGAIISEIHIPEIAQAMAMTGVLYTAEAYGLWKAVIDAAPEKMYPPIRERFLAGASHSGPDYVAAWDRLDQLRAVISEKTKPFDALLAPTAPILPPNLDRLMRDDAFYTTENLLALRNTRVGNLTGGCALTLPTGTPSCGVMLLAQAGEEARLLRLGHAAEKALS